MVSGMDGAFNQDKAQAELLKRKADIMAQIYTLRRSGGILNVSILGSKIPSSKLWEGYAGGNKAVINGYFSNYELAADLILKVDGFAKPQGIYFLQHECDKDLLSRANNRLKAGIGRTSSSEVIQLSNLFFDFDPERISGIPATNGEHELALATADKGVLFLNQLGWPEPLKANSGNGAHLNYAIDLPNTSENVELIKKCLNALSANIHREGVHVDESVFDPARLIRVYGTYSRKGDATDDRPHRLSSICSMPAKPQVVSIELLKALADKAPRIIVSGAKVSGVAQGETNGFNLTQYLESYAIVVTNVKRHGNSTLHVLESCVFDPNHSGGESAIGQTDDGVLFYQCFHNSCQGKTWQEARVKMSGNDQLTSFMGNQTSFPSSGKRSAISAPEPRRRKGKIILRRPPPFPIDVLPEKYQKIVAKLADAFRVSALIPASALLALSGACIGGKRSIEIKRGWEEHPNLYIILVGTSGTGKSPTINAVFKPIQKMEAELLGTNDLIVDDFTLEALSNVLAASPRGAMLFQDEISGLFSCLDRYSGKDGAVKARLMTAYDSGPWKVSRVNGERNIFIPHATLSIYGSIQPAKLKEVFTKSDAASGFLPRFIFLREDNVAPKGFSDAEVDEETENTLNSLFLDLWAYEMDVVSGAHLKIQVTPEARSRYIEWHDEQVAEPWRSIEAEAFEALLAKLRGQGLRIALILHCLDAVASGNSELKPVCEHTMTKAIKLANYFKTHQMAAWQHLAAPGGVEELSPIQKRVAMAILSLKGNISNGMLATCLITDKLNEGQESNFIVSCKSVGKIASSLGFETSHIKGENLRGILISQEDIERFMPLSDAEDAYCIFSDDDDDAA